ncbi:ankyrin repeat domain-containing protein [Rhodoplanes azumiensis]|uniref:Ankyrin repeat domain-containing protein n=1 Tax=Rhodoplanes azumiensis TaxID=1897628 RepID=A0ABW5AQ74_9BRAD
MLFYVQMRWNYQGRISQDQLWDLESLEGTHGVEGIRGGFVQLYKVVSQHRIIAIVNAASLEDLDRNSMGWLPMREYLDFEVVWALRDYEGFLADVRAKFPQPGTAAAPARLPSPLAGDGGAAATGPDATRPVVERWFAALARGDGAGALACLADDVVWINNPGVKGLSDIVPWLGEYHGRAAVEQSFVIWGQLSQVREFELRGIVYGGDEALAIVHERATIKATGLDYDIEFIQRIRVADGRIVFWKSYWDTVQGIVPFRGDMRTRLIDAATRGDRDEAMKVLPFGADPNTHDEASGLPVLTIAAARGHVEMVRTLIGFGADPNALDRKAGTAALHKVAQGGHAEVARLLIGAGAAIDLQATTTGHTPLVEAIWYKAVEIVALLLDHDCRLEPRTSYGFTLADHLEYAKRVSRGVGDAEKLARIEALIAARRGRDEAAMRDNAVIRAVHDKAVPALREALAAGAPIDRRWPVVCGFDDGHTALLVAARDGFAEGVGVLIEAGADVNAVEPVFGAVPLHKATYNGHLDITRRLAAARGVNLDAQGASNGYTPLHDALWHGFADCAEALLDAGARTDIVAFDGKRPIDLAEDKLGPEHPLTRRLRGAVAAAA